MQEELSRLSVMGRLAISLSFLIFFFRDQNLIQLHMRFFCFFFCSPPFFLFSEVFRMGDNSIQSSTLVALCNLEIISRCPRMSEVGNTLYEVPVFQRIRLEANNDKALKPREAG